MPFEYLSAKNNSVMSLKFLPIDLLVKSKYGLAEFYVNISVRLCAYCKAVTTFKNLLASIIKIENTKKFHLLNIKLASEIFLAIKVAQTFDKESYLSKHIIERCNVIVFIFYLCQLSLTKENSVVLKTFVQIARVGIYNSHVLLVREKKLLIAAKGQYLLPIGKKISSGEFGIVHSIPQLACLIDRPRSVIKLARYGDCSMSIKNEFDILTKINPKGTVVGIQIPPYELIYAANPALIGYLAVKYERDYLTDKFEKPPLEERLAEFAQLLSGLHHLHVNNIAHQDIKLSNILVRKDERGNKLVHLADFGNAVDFSMHSPEAQASLERYDICQLGKVFMDVLGGAYPIDLENLFTYLMMRDFDKTPTATGALAILNTILQKINNKNYFNKIKNV